MKLVNRINKNQIKFLLNRYSKHCTDLRAPPTTTDYIKRQIRNELK